MLVSSDVFTPPRNRMTSGIVNGFQQAGACLLPSNLSVCNRLCDEHLASKLSGPVLLVCNLPELINLADDNS